MDLSRFPIEELYGFAVAIEQSGFEFYEKLIQASDNTRVRNELKFLRDEEAQHKAFFQGELGRKDKAQAPIGPGLAGVLQEEFVRPMDEFYREAKVANTREALRFGIALEQKTIEFYGDLRRQSKDLAFLKDLERIIAEEKKHKQKLNIILAY
jgi:rubrerythrin